jgi:L-2-hydroxyglutarate oxidase LhgO
MASYQAEAEAHGASIVLQTTVVALERVAGGWTVETRSPAGERFSLRSPMVVNAAGLDADRIAEAAGLDVDKLGWRHRLCKGDYFAVAPSLGRLARHLIYPVPVPGGLGTHVTVDLGGSFKLGPDVEYIDRPRYDVDPAKGERFASAVGRYLPEIRAEHLTPDFAGVRPKLQGPGEPFGDFVIEEAGAHGAPGLINLIGIESPGLTAAGAIAERVARGFKGDR